MNPARPDSATAFSIGDRQFAILVVLLIAAAVARSAIATRLDSWTQDEDYHTVAGVSYVQRGDFRINPEHPPLVKLWVGAFVCATGGFHLSPFRKINDKADERDFVDEAMYFHNDYDSVQRRTRLAMWALNSLLLMALAFALRFVFGPAPALAVLVILAIDPTVAAHLPLVLTDLPVSLLAATTVVLAGRAFRTWAWSDIALTALALGLAFATKHSAPAFAILIALAGLILALMRKPVAPKDTRPHRIAKLVLLFVTSIIILWGYYGFRYTESSSPAEVFNRPLAEKIRDLNSPSRRFLLAELAAAHILPRAYLWGLADTVRAGVEGRVETRVFYGRIYFGRVTKLFYPGILAAKIPIGFLILILLGLGLFLARRLPEQWSVPCFVLFAVTFGFFSVLAGGATYGGMRHALPAAVLLYIFAGLALYAALASRSRVLRAAVFLALLAAAVSALPVLRPYEYYNEIVGMNRAYLLFNDEGLDAEQRKKELLNYYFQYVKPTGEIPFVYYDIGRFESKARGIDWVGLDPARDSGRLQNPRATGTFFASRWLLSKKPYWDSESLRSAVPVARFGNLFVFRGTFDLQGLTASDFYSLGLQKAFADKPDLSAAEDFFRKSARLDPRAYFVHIELGNLALARGSRDEALAAYNDALRYAPQVSSERAIISEQIRLVSAANPLSAVPPLRDPSLE